MNETYKLIEKISRAKLLLEQGRQRHKDRCDQELDSENVMAPCTCGASEANVLIDRVIRELSLDKEVSNG